MKTVTKAMKRLTVRNERGFTLIELLVVIAIIAILAAIILAALNAAQQGSRDGKRRSDSTQIRSALVQLKSDTGSFPASASYADMTSSSSFGLVSTYLNPFPTPPQNGPGPAQVFRYRTIGEDFDLCIQLERGSSQFLHTTSSSQTVSGVACT